MKYVAVALVVVMSSLAAMAAPREDERKRTGFRSGVAPWLALRSPLENSLHGKYAENVEPGAGVEPATY